MIVIIYQIQVEIITIIFIDQQKHYDYPSLTWDTLKRKRRQNREYSRAKSCVADERGNGARRQCERYRSSPDLYQNNCGGGIERMKLYTKAFEIKSKYKKSKK